MELHKVKILGAIWTLLVLTFMLSLGPTGSCSETITVFQEYTPRDPRMTETIREYTFTTTFGSYIFSKDTGSYQYVYINGTILAPSVRFIIQYFDGKDWQDLNLTDLTFIEASNNILQFRQSVRLQNIFLGSLVVHAEFFAEMPPKLTATFNNYGGVHFRIVFKVTVPQVWEYYEDSEEIGRFNMPKGTPAQLRRTEVTVTETETSTLGLLVDWSDFGVTDVELKGSTVSVQFPDNMAEIDPTTIGTSTSDASTGGSWQRKMFVAQGRLWLFDVDDNYDSVYRSYNGSAWTDKTKIDDSLEGYYFSVDFDGTNVHFVNMTAPTYRRGIVNANGTISGGTWNNPELYEVDTGGTSGSNFPTVSTDSNGYPFIGYANKTGGYRKPYVTKSQWNNGSWSADIGNGFPYLLKDQNQVNWFVNIQPLTSGKMYGLYASTIVYGKEYDGAGSWSIEETISTDGTIPSAVTLNDDVHVVYKSSDSKIKYAKRTYGSGWSTETILATGDSLSCPVICKNGSNLMVFWQKDDTIYFRSYWSGSWHPTQTWTSDSNVAGITVTVPPAKTADLFGIAWTKTGVTSVRFMEFDYEDTAGDFTVTSTNSEFPVYSASWSDQLLQLTFQAQGTLTVDQINTYGEPLSVIDEQQAYTWSRTGDNIQIDSVNGPTVTITFYGSPEGEQYVGGDNPPVTQETTTITPSIVQVPQLGLWFLIGGIGLVVVFGVTKASGRSRSIKRSREKVGEVKPVKRIGSQSFERKKRFRT